ncbi:MAG: hypothetical protein ACI3YT_06180, partial [Prevotella sp.]
MLAYIGGKDSANFAEYTICKDKNCKLQPYLTLVLFLFPKCSLSYLKIVQILRNTQFAKIRIAN